MLLTSGLIHVALIFDSNVLDGALLVLKSSFASCKCPERLAFHVLSTDPAVISDSRLERLKAAMGCHITFQLIDPSRLHGLRQTSHISLDGFARLLLPDLFPDLRRLIYLDSDLFVNSDLSELWAEGLGGMPLAAVADYKLEAVGEPECVGYAISELTRPSAPALNSGVLILDLECWRREGLTGQMLDFCRRHVSQLRQAEQDSFNAVLCGRWRQLPPRWNVQLHALLGPDKLPFPRKQFADFVQDADCNHNAIYHFTGAIKPWNGGPFHPAFLSWLAATERVKRLKGLSRWAYRAFAYGCAFWRFTVRRWQRIRQPA